MWQKSPLTSKKSILLEDLKNQDFVLREEGSGTREFLMDFAKSKYILIVQKWVCHSADSILNIVASEQGLSILSKATLLHQDNIVHIPITDIKLYRSFKLIYHKDKHISSVLEKFIIIFFKNYASYSLISYFPAYSLFY